MLTQPLISIIIPVYNAEKFLDQCLDSVTKQTYKNIEIICINDGSTDKSLDIINKFKKDNRRFHLYNIENQGVSHARNLGLANAKGEFIVFVDSDDYLNYAFCETSLNNQQEYLSDLVCGRRVLRSINKKVLCDWQSQEKVSHSPVEDYDKFTQYHMVTDKLFKTSIIKNNNLQFDETLSFGEDSLFLTQYLTHCDVITASSHSVYTAYKNDVSLSRNPEYKEKIEQQRQIVLAKNKEIIQQYKDTHTPLVSIILTLYEIKPEYLNECLDSLLNQTYKNIEIVAINDCSPNVDYEYIKKISPKIRLYKNEVNMKMNKTVSKAFRLAKGKYIVRMGSDDKFDPTLLEKEVQILQSKPEIGAVCCELQRFGDRHQHIKRPKVWDLKTILGGHIDGCGYAGGMMFRATLLEHCYINQNYKMCEDFDFHLQILEHMPIQSIHEVLYFYRAHETNLCKTVKDVERRKILRTILARHNQIVKPKHSFWN